MNQSIECASPTRSKTTASITPRERLLWLLRRERKLRPSVILSLRWCDLDHRPAADEELAAAIALYRQSLASKYFLTHPDALVFVSRNRGRGGRHVAINRWQLNHLLRKIGQRA